MQAYDIEMLKRPVDRTDPADKGWCFGLPPGIAPVQWPLDPANGYPLVHGFTLLLPEDYRCHGPEIVALSLFGTASEMNDGGPCSTGVEAAFDPATPEPADPNLRDLWARERQKHPRLFRIEDAIGCNWAVILLTEAEYRAPLCALPEFRPKRMNRLEPPEWLSRGAAAAYYDNGKYRFVREALGCEPDADIAFNRAIRWAPRREDPNAGVPTCDELDGQEPTGYQKPRYWQDDKVEASAYRLHAWGEGHAVMHIGGTMRPVQNVPRFSPYHIGFEEEFGGYEFGSGNAQLDFKNMKLDWACG